MSQRHADREGGDDHDPTAVEVKICPDCAETVLAAARRCRFCGYRFDTGRRERRSLLEGLIGGLTRRRRPIELEEILAGWGFAPAAGEAVRFFHPAVVDGRSGYLLVTDRRLAFFGAVVRGSHEQLFERPLGDVTGVVLHGRFVGRRIVLSFGEQRLTVRDDGDRRECAALASHLAAIADR